MFYNVYLEDEQGAKDYIIVLNEDQINRLVVSFLKGEEFIRIKGVKRNIKNPRVILIYNITDSDIVKKNQGEAETFINTMKSMMYNSKINVGLFRKLGNNVTDNFLKGRDWGGGKFDNEISLDADIENFGKDVKMSGKRNIKLKNSTDTNTISIIINWSSIKGRLSNILRLVNKMRVVIFAYLFICFLAILIAGFQQNEDKAIFITVALCAAPILSGLNPWISKHKNFLNLYILIIFTIYTGFIIVNFDKFIHTFKINKPLSKILTSKQHPSTQLDLVNNRVTINSHLKQELNKNWSEFNLDTISKYIYAGGDVNMSGYFGYTALHKAATSDRSSNIALAEFLIKQKANLNSKNNFNTVPLHIAAFCNAKLIAALLIENGAFINAIDNQGSTPLHIAASKNAKDVVKVLLIGGAKVNAMDYDGLTALDHAKNIAIKNLLVSYGGMSGKTTIKNSKKK